MKNELVKLEMDQYGLQEKKAKDIEKLYLPMIGMLTEMEDSFNEIVSQEITAELVPKAKRLRLDIGKVRISANKARESAKAEYLRAGNAIQGAFNTLKYAVESKEEKLLAIEKHFETIEKERIEKLQSDRESKLAEYEPDMHVSSLGEMDESVWKNFIQGIKVAYEQRKAAEKKAEDERLILIEVEKEEARLKEIEDERIRKENERLKKEAEEKEKALAEERARIEDERKASEEKQAAILAKEREDAANKLKAQQKIARIEAEKAAEERARIEAELKAKEDAEIAERKAKEQELAEQKIAEQKAAQAPDKDKLIKSINEMIFIDGEFKTSEAQAVYNVVNQKFEAFKKWAIQQTSSL